MYTKKTIKIHILINFFPFCLFNTLHLVAVIMSCALHRFHIAFPLCKTKRSTKYKKQIATALFYLLSKAFNFLQGGNSVSDSESISPISTIWSTLLMFLFFLYGIFLGGFPTAPKKFSSLVPSVSEEKEV